MKDLLFIASWFPSRIHPTHGNFVARHARAVAKDHRVSVLSIHVDPDLRPGQYEITDEKEEGYRSVRVYFGLRGNAGAIAKIIGRLRAYRRGIRLINRPDLIHAHVLMDAGILAAWLSWWWRVPFLVTEHSTRYLQPEPMGKLRGWLARIAVSRAVRVLPVSSHLGVNMCRVHELSGSYRTIGNVVNTQLYYPDPLVSERFTFLHVSNFREEHKNISGLLKGFSAAIRSGKVNAKLHLAGDGGPGVIERLVQKNLDFWPEWLSVSGPHSEGEIADWMRRSHAFVLFSYYENQPVVLLEAQCCGLPCIATRVGGIPAIIEGSHQGILISPGDTESLTRAIISMHSNYGNFNRAAIGREAALRHGEDAIRAALASEYEEALLTHR